MPNATEARPTVQTTVVLAGPSTFTKHIQTILSPSNSEFKPQVEESRTKVDRRSQTCTRCPTTHGTEEGLPTILAVMHYSAPVHRKGSSCKAEPPDTSKPNKYTDAVCVRSLHSRSTCCSSVSWRGPHYYIHCVAEPDHLRV